MIKVENIKLLQKEVEEIKETSYTSAQIDNMMSTSFEGVFDAMEQYETKSGAEIKYSTKEHKHTASDIEGIDVSVDLSNYYNKQEVDDKVKIKSEFYFAEGETITINNSPCNHNLSDINIYGKTIENNGLMSLGQAENNVIKLKCDSISTINKIPWDKEEYVKLVKGVMGSHVDDYTGAGKVGMIGIPDITNKYTQFIPPIATIGGRIKITVELYTFTQQYRVKGFVSCRVGGRDYTDIITAPAGWRTYEFIVEPNTALEMFYGSRPAGYVGFQVDYESMIVEPVTAEGAINIQLTEPLRSTIDGTVCDELTPTKVIRRVKEENGQIIVLDTPKVELIKPFNLLIKEGNNRITLGNEIKTKIKINYPLTPMSKAIEQENRINDIDTTLYGINTNVEVANERLDGHDNSLITISDRVDSIDGRVEILESNQPVVKQYKSVEADKYYTQTDDSGQYVEIPSTVIPMSDTIDVELIDSESDSTSEFDLSTMPNKTILQGSGYTTFTLENSKLVSNCTNMSGLQYYLDDVKTKGEGIAILETSFSMVSDGTQGQERYLVLFLKDSTTQGKIGLGIVHYQNYWELQSYTTGGNVNLFKTPTNYPLNLGQVYKMKLIIDYDTQELEVLLDGATLMKVSSKLTPFNLGLMGSLNKCAIGDIKGNILKPIKKAKLPNWIPSYEKLREETFQSVSSGKTLLETAITDKGGMVSKVGDVATFEELSNGIKSIAGGEMPPEELAGKQMILDILVGTKPELESKLSLDTPLTSYAYELMSILGYSLRFKEKISPVIVEVPSHEWNIVLDETLKETLTIKNEKPNSCILSETLENVLIDVTPLTWEIACLSINENLKIEEGV